MTSGKSYSTGLVATMYARLSDPGGQGPLAPAVDRVVTAMRAEPYLVGGRNRIDTEVMRAAPEVVAKEGAEALNCAVALSWTTVPAV